MRSLQLNKQLLSLAFACRTLQRLKTIVISAWRNKFLLLMGAYMCLYLDFIKSSLSIDLYVFGFNISSSAKSSSVDVIGSFPYGLKGNHSYQ